MPTAYGIGSFREVIVLIREWQSSGIMLLIFLFFKFKTLIPCAPIPLDSVRYNKFPLSPKGV